MTTKRTEESDRRSLAVGAALVALFFVPDILSEVSVFPIQRVAVLGGVDLAALLTPAVVGALMIAVRLLVPSRTGGRINGTLGAAGALALTLPEDNHLPVAGPLAAIVVAVLLIFGVMVLRKAHRRMPVEALVMIGPALALLVVAGACVTGALSPAYLVSFKTPIVLYLLLKSAVFSAVPKRVSIQRR